MKLESANNIGLDLTDTLSERSLTYIRKKQWSKNETLKESGLYFLPFRKITI
jgi:hypothetical protein